MMSLTKFDKIEQSFEDIISEVEERLTLAKRVCKSKIERLEKSLLKYEVKMEGLEAKLRIGKEEEIALSKEKSMLEFNIDEYKKMLKQRDQHIDALQSEVKDLKALKISQNDVDKNELTDRITELQNKLEDKSKKVAYLYDKVKDVDIIVAQCRTANSEKEEKWQLNRKNLLKKLKYCKLKMEDNKKELQISNDIKEEAEKKKFVLQQDVQISLDAKKVLATKYEKLEKEVVELKNDIKDISNMNKKTKKENDQLKESKVRVETKNERIENENRNLQSMNEKVNKENEMLVKLTEQIKDENKKLLNENEEVIEKNRNFQQHFHKIANLYKVETFAYNKEIESLLQSLHKDHEPSFEQTNAGKFCMIGFQLVKDDKEVCDLAKPYVRMYKDIIHPTKEREYENICPDLKPDNIDKMTSSTGTSNVSLSIKTVVCNKKATLNSLETNVVQSDETDSAPKCVENACCGKTEICKDESDSHTNNSEHKTTFKSFHTPNDESDCCTANDKNEKKELNDRRSSDDVVLAIIKDKVIREDETLEREEVNVSAVDSINYITSNQAHSDDTSLHNHDTSLHKNNDNCRMEQNMESNETHKNDRSEEDHSVSRSNTSNDSNRSSVCQSSRSASSRSRSSRSDTRSKSSISDRSTRSDRSTKSDRSTRSDKSTRSDRSTKNDKSARSDRSTRSERSTRSTSRSSRSENCKPNFSDRSNSCKPAENELDRSKNCCSDRNSEPGNNSGRLSSQTKQINDDEDSIASLKEPDIPKDGEEDVCVVDHNDNSSKEVKEKGGVQSLDVVNIEIAVGINEIKEIYEELEDILENLNETEDNLNIEKTVDEDDTILNVAKYETTTSTQGDTDETETSLQAALIDVPTVINGVKRSVSFNNIVDYAIIDDNSTTSLGDFADVLKPSATETFVLEKTSILDKPDTDRSTVTFSNTAVSRQPKFNLQKFQRSDSDEKITAADIFDREIVFSSDEEEEAAASPYDIDADINFILNM